MSFFTFGKLGRTLLLTAGVVVSVVCVSYSDNPPELVGQWVMEPGELDLPVELFKDGTGIFLGKNITWKTEGKRFVFSGPAGVIVSNYNLTGYELTQTPDNGGVTVWVRKDKVEEYKKKKPEEAKKKAERAKKEAEQRNEKISSYFTDSRNSQKYRAVKIDGKTWMAQNLNYQTGTSWCLDDDNTNCEKYGRLYDWETAKTACPTGWHLPSIEEWNGLESSSGGDATGKTLKSTYGWNDNGNGTDNNGFSALPGGGRSSNNYFYTAGVDGYWWTATERGSDDAYYRGMRYNDDTVKKNDSNKRTGFSVRCIQD